LSGWCGSRFSADSSCAGTEKTCSWPGLGRLMVDSISNRDYALVQGCLLSIGMTCVLANLVTDVVYRWISAHEGM
jgi:ABC-type dipeptide/oligopeptide/nickel transport system permease component